LNMLMRTENVRDISLYISDLEKTISEMKRHDMWNSRKESLVKDLLKDVSDAWKRYGYKDIAQVFIDGLDRIGSSSTSVAAQPERKDENPEKPKEENIY
jgi:hypothetical protein